MGLNEVISNKNFDISDPSPNLLATILGFDPGTVAASHAKLGQVPNPVKGMSGEIKFGAERFRAGDAICQGISVLSAYMQTRVHTPCSFKTPHGCSRMLLQNSSWMLEDALQICGNKSSYFGVTDYQVDMSSFISPKIVIEFVKTNNMTKDVQPCPKISLAVLAHDPFNQHPYRDRWGVSSPRLIWCFKWMLKGPCNKGDTLLCSYADPPGSYALLMSTYARNDDPPGFIFSSNITHSLYLSGKCTRRSGGWT